MFASTPHVSVGTLIRSVAVSLAFWTFLLVSAGCFAAVALSPKYLQSQHLSEQFAAHQRRLVALERQTLQLKEVVAALEQDTAFAEELARVEFDAIRPGEEVLPVDPELRLDPHNISVEKGRSNPGAPPWIAVVAVLALAQDVRATLLLTAATLVIAAFTWLHEPVPHAAAVVHLVLRPSWRQRLWSRYTIP